MSNSPAPRGPFGITDEQLSAGLRERTGTTPEVQPVGELLDRHWEAAFSYARLCADGPQSAGMLTTAAFTRLFGQSLRQSGPTAAWRPQLLVTVRRIAAEWSADHRREMLHPELRAAGDDGDRIGARLLPPGDRRLLSRAFQRLPQAARALLWHTEVEAEPLAAPARLLGIDEEDARAELRRARERLREECLQVHREVAPRQECLLYLRLLDVTYRRGGVDLDPDLRTHLDGCTHCRYTADQLSRFNADLGAALAEGILGWGARAYRDSRLTPTAPEDPAAPPSADGEPFVPVGGEPFDSVGPGAPSPGEPFAAAASGPEPGVEPASVGRGGAAGTGSVPASAGREAAPDSAAGPASAGAGVRPRAGGRRMAQKAARRAARQRNLAIAVATVSGLVALPLVLWAVLGSGDGANATGAGGRPSDTPGSGSASAGPSWIGAGAAGRTTLRGRLHNVASGLCVGVVGRKAVEGAETELTSCSPTPDQQWVYETDGLLRSGAAPGLCLDSRLGYSVRLAPCTGSSGPGPKDIRYDFTLRGDLVPRFDQDLALTPAATDGGGALVLKTRAKSDTQRWVMDTSTPDPQLEVVNWGADGGSSGRASSAPPTPRPSATVKQAVPPAPATTAPRTTPRPTSDDAGPSPTDSCDAHDRSCSRDRDWRHRRPGGGRGGR
ncbi:ricin-type beta-trefoil lectin domain protein [Streptomyces kebangsaanensis]|uniref:Ricin-type beta-trefoil lectin domain protein n=1 Tax=Streptomyces kebangsaanensis TaxID=864058 RepID=A0ABW6L2R2_9ACTN